MTAKEWLKIPEGKLLAKLQSVLPGLSKIDWNTAMEAFRNAPKTEATVQAARDIYRAVTGQRARMDRTVVAWLLETAQPEHYLIAAALAAEGE